MLKAKEFSDDKFPYAMFISKDFEHFDVFLHGETSQKLIATNYINNAPLDKMSMEKYDNGWTFKEYGPALDVPMKNVREENRGEYQGEAQRKTKEGQTFSTPERFLCIFLVFSVMFELVYCCVSELLIKLRNVMYCNLFY